MTQNSSFKCGFVALVGRPNVGKSTLMNHLIGQKISITSKKAQTTRNKIRGIYTDHNSQLIFVDTPGFQTYHQNALNQKLNQNVIDTLKETDLVLCLIEAGRFTDADREIINKIPQHKPRLLVINKIDKIKTQVELEIFIDGIKKEYQFDAISVVSAKHGLRITNLIELIKQYLPIGIQLYPNDMLTDRSGRFLAMEIIREKVFRYIGEELPYSINVEIDSFVEEPEIYHIHATILVDKTVHKGIVIGKNGDKLKKISTEARLDMEKLFDSKVFLKIWVKVKSGWSDDIRFLTSLE